MFSAGVGRKLVISPLSNTDLATPFKDSFTVLSRFRLRRHEIWKIRAPWIRYWSPTKAGIQPFKCVCDVLPFSGQL
jgi:hypothetical protein